MKRIKPNFKSVAESHIKKIFDSSQIDTRECTLEFKNALIYELTTSLEMAYHRGEQEAWEEATLELRRLTGSRI